MTMEEALKKQLHDVKQQSRKLDLLIAKSERRTEVLDDLRDSRKPSTNKHKPSKSSKLNAGGKSKNSMTDLEKNILSDSQVEDGSSASAVIKDSPSTLESTKSFPSFMNNISNSVPSNPILLNGSYSLFNCKDVPQLATPSSSLSGSISGDDLNERGSPIPPSLVNAQNYLTFAESSDNQLDLSELKEVIANCEASILKSEERSEERRWLVRRLIELRYRFTLMKESLEDNSDSPLSERRVVGGHHFSLQKRYTAYQTKKFCERCTHIIWSVLVAWYECLDCGYECHIKCIEDTIRVCANVQRAEKPHYETRICPETNLASQNFKCAECKSTISFRSTWQEPRLCDYNGKYYCPTCHWNTLMVSPARVIHNWDFTAQPVCRASYQLLKLMMCKPLISLQKMNGRLFGVVDELVQIKKLREDILVLKRYLISCRIALEKNLVWQYFKRRQYFLEDSDTYSLQDLIDINNGALQSSLESIRSNLIKHVKSDCQICFGRGFYCEYCDSKVVIFPFDIGVDTCSKCETAYHHKCLRNNPGKCKKCERINKRLTSPDNSNQLINV